MALNVFVSYSQKDHLAATLIGTLRANRTVSIFIAHQFQTPGMSISDKVLYGLRHCDLVLLLWSANAAASEWVPFEIEAATRLNKRIMPVLLTDDAELPPAIRDIEALPLYRNPEAGMTWLAHHLGQSAAPWWQHALTGITGGKLSLGKLAAVGAAIGIGLLAASTEQQSEPETKPPARKRSGRGGRARRAAPFAP